MFYSPILNPELFYPPAVSWLTARLYLLLNSLHSAVHFKCIQIMSASRETDARWARLSLPPRTRRQSGSICFRATQDFIVGWRERSGRFKEACHSDFPSSCVFSAYQTASWTLSCQALCLLFSMIYQHPINCPLKLQLKMAKCLTIFKNCEQCCHGDLDKVMVKHIFLIFKLTVLLLLLIMSL